METTNLTHRSALRPVRLLVAGYLALSLLTVLAVVALRHHTGIVTQAVWIRTIIVAASALLTTGFAAQAARGSRGGYRRLRIVSIAMLVAIVVIIALPGVFPAWLKVEQGVCALFLLGVVVLTNRRQLRALFAR